MQKYLHAGIFLFPFLQKNGWLPPLGSSPCLWAQEHNALATAVGISERLLSQTTQQEALVTYAQEQVTKNENGGPNSKTARKGAERKRRLLCKVNALTQQNVCAATSAFPHSDRS